MLGVLAPAGVLAASSSTSSFLPPWIVLVFIGLALISTFMRASARRRARTQRNGYTAVPPRGYQPGPHAGPKAGPQATVQQNTAVPYQGTLLNGVPIKGYTVDPGQQAGFANERMRAEAELRRQLEALDAARRSGQVTAEQYAKHREAIFKHL